MRFHTWSTHNDQQSKAISKTCCKSWMEASCKSFVEELGVAWNSFLELELIDVKLEELSDVSCNNFLEEPMVGSN